MEQAVRAQTVPWQLAAAPPNKEACTRASARGEGSRQTVRWNKAWPWCPRTTPRPPQALRLPVCATGGGSAPNIRVALVAAGRPRVGRWPAPRSRPRSTPESTSSTRRRRTRSAPRTRQRSCAHAGWMERMITTWQNDVLETGSGGSHGREISVVRTTTLMFGSTAWPWNSTASHMAHRGEAAARDARANTWRRGGPPPGRWTGTVSPSACLALPWVRAAPPCFRVLPRTSQHQPVALVRLVRG